MQFSSEIMTQYSINALLLVIFLINATVVHADDITSEITWACTETAIYNEIKTGKANEVRLTQEIPEQITKVFHMANPGEYWNSGDFFNVYDSTPVLVLRFAAQFQHIWLIHYAHGGIFGVENVVSFACEDAQGFQFFILEQPKQPTQGGKTAHSIMPRFYNTYWLQQALQSDWVIKFWR